MSDIEWGAPPPKATGRTGAAVEFVAALKTRPGEWAKYPTAMSNCAASNLRQRFPGTEWTGRKQADGKSLLWGRWVSPKDAA